MQKVHAPDVSLHFMKAEVLRCTQDAKEKAELIEKMLFETGDAETSSAWQPLWIAGLRP